MIINDELQLAFDMLQHTGTSVFLTGKAGTGKTTFLKELKKTSPKRMIVLAPTGVAAINAGGVTIHSFFQLPFCPYIAPEEAPKGQDSLVGSFRFSRDKLNIIRSLDLLVIDEISMVRADLLDAIDDVLRKYKRKDKPFGGVQLLMIGDVQQLAPVVKDDEWMLLRKYYDTPYFFSSKALRSIYFVCIELKEIFRQTDKEFINILNSIREGNSSKEILEKLNKRYIANFKPKDGDGFITLTTHNAQAKKINEEKLDEIAGKEYTYTAEIEGDFPQYSYPTDEILTLKKGAQVMFIKNDPSADKKYYNGKIGIIDDISFDKIYVRCPDDDECIPVTPQQWTNAKYTIDKSSHEITEDIIGTFEQMPLKLAWAITIHKSQGLTFDKVVIDAAAAFAHGQVYVALSRCRTMDGLVLSSLIGFGAIREDNNVKAFSKEAEAKCPDENVFSILKKNYFIDMLLDLFSFSYTRTKLEALNTTSRIHLNKLFPRYVKTVDQQLKLFDKNVINVENNFKFQLKQLMLDNPHYEDDKLLQERIHKAAEYFYDKITDLANAVSGNDLDIDNVETSIIYEEASKKLADEINIKAAVLKNVKEKGFNVSSYLSTKSRATIETPSKKKSSAKGQTTKDEKDIKNVRLYNTLREWRNAQADIADIKPYQIMKQATLIEIANKLPKDETELLKINGIGKVTIRKYGEEILEILNEYITDNNLLYN